MNDMKLFDSYRKEWTRNRNHNDYCDVDHLLRFWRENKAQYLAPLFGEDLILEQDIVYDKPKDLIQNDMYGVIDRYGNFLNKITEKLAEIMGVNSWGWHSDDKVTDIVWRQLRYAIQNSVALTENTLDLGYKGYNADGPEYIKQYTLEFENGKKVVLQRGMKITRAFAQICKQFDWESEWEEFRIQHSQVLNTKRMTGTLCLSIHPLDYATASDNDNGWSSCMSWNDYGCYRMGTVEMMNSPMVICAYLKSKKQHMEINGEEWNSKKWRAWVIVTKDVILVNRHYPYHQDEMAIQCINWVRDLVKSAYGWEYDDPHTDFYSWMREVDYEIEFRTNYMYNDLGGEDVIGCYRKDWKPRTMPGYINFSGPAECMICGEEIEPECQEASQLECDKCWCEYTCDECGEGLGEDEVYRGPNGEPLCYDCYDRICMTCTCCDDVHYTEDMTQVQFPVRYDKLTDEQNKIFTRAFGDRYNQHYNGDFQWMFERKPASVGDVQICENCANDFGVTDIEYEEKDNCGVEPGEYTVMDPDMISMNKYFNLIGAPGYEYAQYYLNRLKSGRIIDEDGEGQKYYQAILDFWTDQWDRFKVEWKNLREE